jgi:tetratricopeptide (TPR) repeat protein
MLGISRSIRQFAASFAAIALVNGCNSAPPSHNVAAAAAELPPGVQAISFLGDTLRELPLAADVRARYEEELAAARTAYEHTPQDLDSIVWFGRRLAYLGRFREAIDVYTKGLDVHADNPWLLRHRGHRWISVRDLDRAIDDLERATQLVAGTPDIVEPDGRPNAQNTPIGSLHSNIAYHLGLAHYLAGNWARAADVYRIEYDSARNDDRRVSAGHWLYMSLRRLGRDDEAAAVLVPISANMTIIENHVYHRLMRMYKGEIPVDSVLPVNASGEMSVTDASAAYGIGNWHLYNGRRDEANVVFQRIVDGGQWGAFGFVAAERDLARGNP